MPGKKRAAGAAKGAKSLKKATGKAKPKKTVVAKAKPAKASAADPSQSKVKAKPEAKMGAVAKIKAAVQKVAKAVTSSSAEPEGKPVTAKVEPKTEVAKRALKAAQPSKPEKSKARKISVDVKPNEAASALAQKWNTLFKKAAQIEVKPYNMKASFEERTAIHHKVLGWGYILANRNDRLEVLFKDGIKYLISNYRS
ncbi:MAG: hypothetical protein AB7F86_19390 [Bdellovibrionales bacterium]